MAEHMMIDGKCINIYTCSRAREEQMERNGWHCVIPDRGFSNNSCRLVLVVGCCENSMAKSTHPARPCNSMSSASQYL